MTRQTHIQTFLAATRGAAKTRTVCTMHSPLRNAEQAVNLVRTQCHEIQLNSLGSYILTRKNLFKTTERTTYMRYVVWSRHPSPWAVPNRLIGHNINAYALGIRPPSSRHGGEGGT